jgi:hypothetical protein
MGFFENIVDYYAWLYADFPNRIDLAMGIIGVITFVAVIGTFKVRDILLGE